MKRSHKAIEEDLSKGRVDHNNSPTLALSSGESFTGPWTCVEEYASVSVLVIIDTAGGESGTLVMELSPDTTNTRSKSVLISLGNSSVHTLSIVSRYFRISFNADQSTTCTGVIQTLYHHYRTQGLMSFVGETINDQNDAQLVRAVITGANDAGEYGNVHIDNGHMNVISNQVDTFGQTITVSPESYVFAYQQSSIVNPQIHPVTLTGDGYFTKNTDGSMELGVSGGFTSAGVTYFSRRSSKYRPGFDNHFVWECKWEDTLLPGIADVALASNGTFSVGFGNFGLGSFDAVLLNQGVLGAWVLQVTTAADTAGTATLTIGGLPYDIELTDAGTDVEFTAYEIDAASVFDLSSNVFQYDADHVGDTVIFRQAFANTDTTLPVFNDGGTNAVVSITKFDDGTGERNGVGQSFLSTPQAFWNGSSAVMDTFDYSKWNTFRVRMNGVGPSVILWDIYNPDSRQYETVHSVCCVDGNLRTGASLSISVINASLGTPQYFPVHKMYTSGFHTLNIGQFSEQGARYSIDKSKVATATEQIMLCILHRGTVNGQANRSEIRLDRLSVATEGTKSVKIKVVKVFFREGAQIGSGTTSDFLNPEYIDEENSIALVDTVVNNYTPDPNRRETTTIYEFVMAKNESLQVDYSERGLTLNIAEAMLITAQTSSSTSDVDVALSWFEDF